ncbi:hypothetical protein B0D95_10185 [Cellvibrio sp. PSBB023]|nr:hypothetical protein B0D95_10185 [Cellvibrio sp. PSBB023]
MQGYTELLLYKVATSLTKCINSCAGQFLSRGFVVLLRKSNPQIHNLKTAVVHGVMRGLYQLKLFNLGKLKEMKASLLFVTS